MTILKKRTAIIAFMLLAVLVMGIGYAAFSTKLTVNGIADVDAEAIKFTDAVLFVGAASDNTTFGKAALGTDADNPSATPTDKATFKVFGMTRSGETVKFTYTIKNNYDVPVSVNVTIHPTTTESSKFTVSQSLTAPITIAVGETAEVVVTVILKEDVSEAVADVGYVIEYTATGLES